MKSATERADINVNYDEGRLKRTQRRMRNRYIEHAKTATETMNES